MNENLKDFFTAAYIEQVTKFIELKNKSGIHSYTDLLVLPKKDLQQFGIVGHNFQIKFGEESQILGVGIYVDKLGVTTSDLRYPTHLVQTITFSKLPETIEYKTIESYMETFFDILTPQLFGLYNWEFSRITLEKEVERAKQEVNKHHDEVSRLLTKFSSGETFSITKSLY